MLVNRPSTRIFPLAIILFIISHEKQTKKKQPNQLKNSKSKNRLKKEKKN
jgi:hypothetical protein